MKKRLYRFIFYRLLGWSILGEMDPNVRKSVLIVIPHTSWHDFYIGLFARGILGIDIRYVAKQELFDSFFGWYFRWMGGSPIDRSGKLNKVDAVAKAFDNTETFHLAIAPEGTRKKVATLKSGFYFIALKAGAAIIPVAFDYSKKEVRIGRPVFPGGDYNQDLKIILSHFVGAVGRIPAFSFDAVAAISAI
ncbi:MAG: acyltransferase [Flavobacterium sp.]|nr:MAG: acyltransferase [Flavobacterium sp.]